MATKCFVLPGFNLRFQVQGWSETIKRLWDEDAAAAVPLRLLLSGSSPLLVQKGLTESLGGRFEIIPAPHWSYTEMKAAFGWSVEQYVYFGGYPGAASLIEDENRWRRYIVDALIVGRWGQAPSASMWGDFVLMNGAWQTESSKQVV